MTPHSVPNSAPPTGPVISPGMGEMITCSAWIAMNTSGAHTPHERTVSLRKCLSWYSLTRNRTRGASETTNQIVMTRHNASVVDATAHRFVSLQVAGPRLGEDSVTEAASLRSTVAPPH